MKGLSMCNSLAEGGLRCPSHVNKDIEALKLADEAGLRTAAKEAGIPIDQKHVDEAVVQHMDLYSRQAEAHEEKEARVKESLLLAHKLTMDAKNALNDPTIRDTDDFISPYHDFVAVTDSLREKLAREGKKDPSKEEATTELKNSPEFQSFERMEEFIDTTHLSAYQDSRINTLKEKYRTQSLALDQQRLDGLHRDNPMLKKLRRKAAIADFINPMGHSTYAKDQAYATALEEEKRRKGFQRSTEADFPELTKELRQAEIYGQQIDARRREINTAFENHAYEMRRQGATVKYPYAHHAERLILKAEPSGTYRQLAYKDRLRTFNSQKATYTELASKEFNVANEEKRFRAEATEKAPFQTDRLKEFKKEVYDKTPEAKKIDAEMRQKRVQLSMTPQFRSKLETQARNTSNPENAEKLRARKKKLDALAEKTMGENRLKAMAQTGKIPQGLKDGMKAQIQAAPAHYRTNLANS